MVQGSDIHGRRTHYMMDANINRAGFSVPFCIAVSWTVSSFITLDLSLHRTLNQCMGIV